MVVAFAQAYEVTLEHAFGASAPFAYRNTLDVNPSSPKSKMLKFSPASVAVSEADSSALTGLLSSDGFYRVRARSGSSWVTASIRACDLARADFKEDLGVVLSARGDVVALNFNNLKATSRGCDATLPAEALEITSTATPQMDTVAQVIPVQAKVGKPPSGMGEILRDGPGERGPGGEVGPDGEKAPPKGILQKYWHILLPLALLLLTTKEPEPESVKKTGGGAPAAAPAK